MNTQDTMTMQLEADFMTAFDEIKECLDKYHNLYMSLTISEENIIRLQAYHSGLKSLAEAFEALGECFHSLCGTKNITL